MRKRQDYCELFLDIICELENEQDALYCMQGFEAAMISALMYHEEEAKKYKELHRRFLLADIDP